MKQVTPIFYLTLILKTAVRGLSSTIFDLVGKLAPGGKERGRERERERERERKKKKSWVGSCASFWRFLRSGLFAYSVWVYRVGGNIVPGSEL